MTSDLGTTGISDLNWQMMPLGQPLTGFRGFPTGGDRAAIRGRESDPPGLGGRRLFREIDTVTAWKNLVNVKQFTTKHEKKCVNHLRQRTTLKAQGRAGVGNP